MDDLISRAGAIAEVEEYLQGLDSCISEPDLKLDGYRNGLHVAINELKGLPTIDAIPVVRCKDCEHSYFASNRTPDEQCWACGKHGIDVTPEWYCADGERRDDDAAD